MARMPVIAALVLATGAPASALAAPGDSAAGAGWSASGTTVTVTFTNDGSAPQLHDYVQFPGGFTATGGGFSSGAEGTFEANGGGPNTGEWHFQPPGLAPGATFVGTITTDAPVPCDTTLQLFVNSTSDPSQYSQEALPHDGACGTPPPACRWDWDVKVAFANQRNNFALRAYGDFSEKLGDLTATVANAGECASDATNLLLSSAYVGSQGEVARAGLLAPQGCPADDEGVFRCPVPMLEPGEAQAFTVPLYSRATEGLNGLVNGSVVCDADGEDGRCANNQTELDFFVVDRVQIYVRTTVDPLKQRLRPGQAFELRGDASAGGRQRAVKPAVKRVEVAIVREDAAGCRWLTSTKPRFTAGAAKVDGLCTGLRFVRATGTASWRLRLPRGLPKGRYAAYARATDGTGRVQRDLRGRARVRFAVR